MDVQGSSNDGSQNLHNQISNPSEVIKHFWEFIEINGTAISMTLITMKRSFLLTVNNFKPSELTGQYQTEKHSVGVLKDSIKRGFMGTNNNLKGLSLAIGELNTCIIGCENSLDSAMLASKLSKKLNDNKPVYVAYNVQLPLDTEDGIGSTAKLYMKVFQFVSANYHRALP